MILKNALVRVQIVRVERGPCFDVLADFALERVLLRPDVGRMVFDKTGIDGEFDFRLTFASLRAGVNSDLPFIFGAVEQLGLKLQPDHGLVPFLVVEHAESPSPN